MLLYTFDNICRCTAYIENAWRETIFQRVFDKEDFG